MMAAAFSYLARAYFLRATTVPPDVRRQLWGRAELAFQQAIDQGFDVAEAWFFLGKIYMYERRFREAEACFGRALERDPESRDAKWNRGLALLELGRWAEGWKGYNAGLTQSLNSSQQRKRRYDEGEGELPYWDGKPGQSVVVYGE